MDESDRNPVGGMSPHRGAKRGYHGFYPWGAMISNIIRALRLPFLSASVLPFIYGSLAVRSDFDVIGFILGIAAASFAHLSANLINDYADSRSGADWQDRRSYAFFGGSKLIQEGVFSEKFYLCLAIITAALALIAVAGLSLRMGRYLPCLAFLVIIFLSWAYSQKPFRLSYRYMGEPVIFVLFGPALVMGGYFIQTGIFPDIRSLILSLPAGFFVAAILFANEVPDHNDDLRSGKLTWAILCKPAGAYRIYYLIMFLAFSSILLNVALGLLPLPALISFILILPAVKAGNILRTHHNDKVKMIDSSKAVIAVQTLATAVLIIAELTWPGL